jgi:hypothetical protein
MKHPPLNLEQRPSRDRGQHRSDFIVDMAVNLADGPGANVPDGRDRLETGVAVDGPAGPRDIIDVPVPKGPWRKPESEAYPGTDRVGEAWAVVRA